jgi:hypothetical protein
MQPPGDALMRNLVAAEMERRLPFKQRCLIGVGAGPRRVFSLDFTWQPTKCGQVARSAL